jgi:hypothetical protein
MKRLYYTNQNPDLQRYFDRQSRWVALKAWWQAQRQLDRAVTPEQIQKATESVNTVRKHYGEILDTALPLWDRAQAYKHTLGLIQQTRQMQPGEPDKLWQDIVLKG